MPISGREKSVNPVRTKALPFSLILKGGSFGHSPNVDSSFGNPSDCLGEDSK